MPLPKYRQDHLMMVNARIMVVLARRSIFFNLPLIHDRVAAIEDKIKKIG